MGDVRVGLRARLPPSRASRTAAGAWFALTEDRLATTAVNLTQIDSPLAEKAARLPDPVPGGRIARVHGIASGEGTAAH